MDRSLGNPLTSQTVERKSRRIGIHGPRNAGKTCFLGCLYGFRIDENVQLTLADDTTIRYLAGIWAEIAQQKNPAATGMALPTNLVAEIGGPASQPPATIQLCDYAGALMEAASTQAPTLARDLSQGVRGWFRSCHAVLVFLDSSKPDMDQIDAIDLLLTELSKPQQDSATLAPPLGLVLTKWDTLGPVSGDAAYEEKRASDYLESNSVFRQISQKVADGGERIKIIPVSAFGNNARDNRPPPPDLLVPCHLYAPLLWAVKAADATILAEAMESAQRRLNRKWTVLGLPLCPYPDYEAALSVFRVAKRDFAASPGPLSVLIDQEMDAVRLGRWRRRLTVFGSIAAACFGIVAFVWLCGHYSADEEFQRLTQHRQQHPDPEQAAQQLEEETRFLNLWHSLVAPSEQTQVDRWVIVDTGIVEEADQRAYEEFRQVAGRDGKQPTANEANQRAQNYLNGTGPRRMAGAVEEWRTWFNAMHTCTITVESYSIPPNSKLAKCIVSVSARVLVKVSENEYFTGWNSGTNASPKKALGPFPFTWKNPEKVEIKVEAAWLTAMDPLAKATEDLSDILLGKDNGQIIAYDDLGIPVTVHLACDFPPPPALPPYRSR